MFIVSLLCFFYYTDLRTFYSYFLHGICHKEENHMILVLYYIYVFSYIYFLVLVMQSSVLDTNPINPG